jgi:hypothetical protein
MPPEVPVLVTFARNIVGRAYVCFATQPYVEPAWVILLAQAMHTGQACTTLPPIRAQFDFVEADCPRFGRTA